MRTTESFTTSFNLLFVCVGNARVLNRIDCSPVIIRQPILVFVNHFVATSEGSFIFVLIDLDAQLISSKFIAQPEAQFIGGSLVVCVCGEWLG